LEHHLITEEGAVFPLLESLEGSAWNGELAQEHADVGQLTKHLESEHRKALEALERLRELRSGHNLPDGSLGRWRELLEGLEELDRDLKEHIRLEGEVLFPRSLELEKVALAGGSPPPAVEHAEGRQRP
jgi:regulator of cell morphogenesis and NO signaling